VALAVAVVAACGGDDSALDPPATTSAPPTTHAPGASTDAPRTSDAPTTTGPGEVERLRVEVIERRPHDPDAFTQGFEQDYENLYESTGLYGESSVRRVDPETGEVRDRYDLPDDQFGEGLTLADGRLIVLTWREGIAHVLHPASLDPITTFRYDTEGWGICADLFDIYMSDGTSTIYMRDLETFEETGRIQVTLEGEPVDQLNELECHPDGIYANVWHTDTILRIDPETGVVRSVIDASGLLEDGEVRDPEAVLNGIAYDLYHHTFLLTGKRWPAMFEVRFVPA
jgi:glutaminyl-peptide cyclotransferase